MPLVQDSKRFPAFELSKHSTCSGLLNLSPCPLVSNQLIMDTSNTERYLVGIGVVSLGLCYVICDLVRKFATREEIE